MKNNCQVKNSMEEIFLIIQQNAEGVDNRSGVGELKY